MSNGDTITGVHGSCLILIDTIDNLQQNVLSRPAFSIIVLSQNSEVARPVISIELLIILTPEITSLKNKYEKLHELTRYRMTDFLATGGSNFTIEVQFWF